MIIEINLVKIKNIKWYELKDGSNGFKSTTLFSNRSKGTKFH